MAEDEEVYGEMAEEQLEMEEDLQEAAGEEGASSDDLEAMKAKLKQMEEEAAKLKAIQAKVQQEAGLGTGEENEVPAGEAGSREEADSRSIYVGNVDYSCTPEELQVHFQSCGTVNRVTILTDKFGQAKGFAYVEFLETDAVEAAVLLNDSELRGRQIKVSPKRTNVPGLKMVDVAAEEAEATTTPMAVAAMEGTTRQGAEVVDVVDSTTEEI
eukprot:CAMPEP_0117667364 /NCGR_PEP_ID=MMETSP0804-20121206/10920_1 /TAXON_ID=1074897 /ORGANISM="Tetraselmis astigmatica, Strain CCMP880" /LENGTH=212 /DNA_ID=CAMNT_0005475071 /DNA_START=116 /DNA_END=755 /DNA_ORIENTATION=-